ncbi:heme lyase CcmF/NrfE family subunit [Persicobacter sp. CCB-QB2]|uniref:heme lyase CcmF/NrfE family subunit n=1 Tax=Persicobacter sp. CCB-QB2 TaxID=1561025 RepID=UPI0006A9CC03|nr:cytochrome c biogenesis protein CcsA [Persicobacter sp. CCB-QB2]
MINTFIGNLGHFLTVFAFITSLVATFAYFKATNANELKKNEWLKNGRWAFSLHTLSIVGVFATLFAIVSGNYFEYHYAWSHSSIHLPWYYMLSAMWEGQEGSFLIWMVWNALLGMVLIFTNKSWEGPLMAVFALVQAYLASMILGTVIGNMQIGMSPFALMRDAMDAPIFQSNPDFIPEDGSGLNPLLQSYWMVIHPPILFLGFATTLIPFAYAVAALWTKRYRDWVRPALPWTLFSAAILGLGILLGAYWAYETLNFGGYWNWDPVENASYVPWLVLVAAIHTMIVFKKNHTALKSSLGLCIAGFVLIVYSTFLTRSGILGNASVHSFTDLGLSGQLLIYLAAFTLGGFGIFLYRWKDLPVEQDEPSVYSREFWIFIGATTLCLMGFQVIIPTSIPVWNAIVEAFGGISNVALPTDQVAFYSKFQLWFAVAIALLSGTGQFFYWKKMDSKKLWDALTVPFLITLVSSGAIILLYPVAQLSYIALLTAAVYCLSANGTILFNLIRKSPKLSGGAVTHIGMALMLIGILFSAGYSNVVSLNQSGMPIFKDAADEKFDQENIVLWINRNRPMENYQLNYKGRRLEVMGMPNYVDHNLLSTTGNERKRVAKTELAYDGKTYFNQGDTVEVHPENIYFEVDYTDQKGEKFTLYPRAQVNPNMGMVISPDIKRGFNRDLYTHVTAFITPDQEAEWSAAKSFEAKMGAQFIVNDFVCRFDSLITLPSVGGMSLGPNDVAVQAKIQIFDSERSYFAEPIFLIKGNQVGKIPEVIEDLGIKLSLANIKPEEGIFVFEAQTTQKDYIVLKALEKPFINVLWIGTLLVMIGFGIATNRRYREFKNLRDRNAINDSKKVTAKTEI